MNVGGESGVNASWMGYWRPGAAGRGRGEAYPQHCWQKDRVPRQLPHRTRLQHCIIKAEQRGHITKVSSICRVSRGTANPAAEKTPLPGQSCRECRGWN